MSHLNLKEMKKHFESVIWNRGKAYFRENLVRSIDGKFPEFVARVTGSGRNVYTVRVTINASGGLVRESCTCPYPEPCKHTAAVLLKIDEDGLWVAEEQKAEKEKTLLQNTMWDFLPKTMEGVKEEHFYTAHIVENIIKTRSNSNRRFKLSFQIADQEVFQKAENQRLSIVPCLICIKKDGSNGRLEKFHFDKITEVPPDPSLDLLVYYLNNGRQRIDFASNFETIVQQKIPILLDEEEVLYDIPQKVHVAFVPSLSKGMDYIYFEVFVDVEGEKHAFEKVLVKDTFIQTEKALWFCLVNRILFYEREPQKISALAIIKKFYYHAFHNETLIWKKDWPFGNDFFMQIDWPKSEVEIVSGIPQAILDVEVTTYLGDENVEMIPKFRYGKKEFSFQKEKNRIALIEIIKDGYRIHQRQMELEAEIIGEIVDIFQDFAEPYYGWDNEDTYVRFQFFGDLDVFIESFLDILTDINIEVRIKGEKVHYEKKAKPIRISLNSQAEWFEVKMHISSESDEPMDLSFIESGMIRQGNRFFKLSKKDRKIIRQWIQEGMDQEGKFRVHSKNFSALKDMESKLIQKDDKIKNILKIYSKLLGKTKIPMVQTAQSFKATLRPYQQEGLNWLRFLYDHNLNGCLADDMGLGKTVQMLALFTSIRESGVKGTFLIIAPVTTLPNWEAEIARFAPNLSVLRHHGNKRDKESLIKTSDDVILTSYHTLRNDLEFFEKMTFNILVLDESQFIKNAQSKAFKAVRQIKSAHRFSLTGTPVENRTLELWSQMDFLNPGLLEDRKTFSRCYARPIEEYGDEKKAARLRVLTHPFILRRKKQEVLKDLPDKEEVILYCEMEGKQRKLYEQTAGELLARVKSSMESKGKQKSAIMVFAALLKLRQICLFPGLVDEQYEDLESVKFQSLKELIGDALTEGHKILLFSQFVKVLDRIEPLLKSVGVKFVRLDGSTRNREKPVQQFQEDAETQVFLVSLKAGNTGINLTAADYVVLFDPWWNPAVESQAIDRAHRIGQTRKVFSYRLVVKDSVEEKIIALQERKKQLVDNLMARDSAAFVGMTEKEILEFFK